MPNNDQHSQPSDRIAALLDQAETLNRNLIALARELSASRSDGDDWTRMPRPGTRCKVAGFSRAKLERLAADDLIRKKRVGGASFYSAADVRAYVATALRRSTPTL